MDEDDVLSLHRLAAQSGRGRAALRKMIESKELVATRSEEGRQEWLVTRADALAAGLQLPFGSQSGSPQRALASEAPGGAALTVDSALARVLGLGLRPIEARLSEIERSHGQLLSEMQLLRRLAEAHEPKPVPVRIQRSLVSWLRRVGRVVSGSLGRT